jgi:hypothetical protein
MLYFKVKLLLSAIVLLLLLPLLSGCAYTPDLDSQIREVTNPYRFRLLNWEVKTLSGEAVNILDRHQAVTDNTTSQERLIEQRVRAAFSEQGIYNPLDRFVTLKFGFPPVDIYVGKPPHLLVVSPRDRIENISEVTLLPDIDEKDMEAIEAKIDALGYSALVVDLGGLSTFPSYITNEADIKFIIDTTAHEWLHLYLTFTPLGFLNLLDTIGLRHDYDISTMNESVADMVSQEIGETVYQKFYAPPPTTNTAPELAEPGFDFNKEMREIRLAVDSYLAKGEIETAENFMEAKRQYLAANGYNLRKLNQAYFAFYGTYADSPTSVNPIGAELKELRSQSASLKDFLDTVAAMTSPRDLAESVR